MAGVARVGDIGIGICYCHVSPTNYTTVFAAGSAVVTADGIGVIRVGDVGVASCGHPTIALTGSGLVVGGGIGLHRVGDTGTNCGPYTCVSGSSVVDSL